MSYVEEEGLLHWRPPENPGVVMVQVPPSLLLLDRLEIRAWSWSTCPPSSCHWNV